MMVYDIMSEKLGVLYESLKVQQMNRNFYLQSVTDTAADHVTNVSDLTPE